MAKIRFCQDITLNFIRHPLVRQQKLVIMLRDILQQNANPPSMDVSLCLMMKAEDTEPDVKCFSFLCNYLGSLRTYRKITIEVIAEEVGCVELGCEPTQARNERSNPDRKGWHMKQLKYFQRELEASLGPSMLYMGEECGPYNSSNRTEAPRVKDSMWCQDYKSYCLGSVTFHPKDHQ